MSAAGEFLVRAVACVKVADERAAAQAHSVVVADGEAPVIDLLGNGLMAVYLVDEGDRFVWVQHKHCQALNANPRGLMEFGLANLSRLAAKQLQLGQVQSLYVIRLDGHFEASLLLLDDLWDRALKGYTPNGAVVAIPARDVIAFCDRDNAQGVQELKEMAARVVAGGEHVLTAQLFQRRDEAWVPYPG